MSWLRQLVVLLVMLAVVARADAQALPAFTGAVNKAIGKTVEKTAQRRGFAANDPRMAATMNDMASAAATVAGTVTAAAVAGSAPVWLTVAAGLGAAAVVGGLVYGVYKLFFDDSSSQAGFVVQKPGTGGATAPTNPPAGTTTTTGTPTDTAKYISYVDRMGVQTFAEPGVTYTNGLEYTRADGAKLKSYDDPLNLKEQYAPGRTYAVGVWWYGTSIAKLQAMWKDYYAREGGVGDSTCGPRVYKSGYGEAHDCVITWKWPWSNQNSQEVQVNLRENPFYSTPGETIKGTVADIVSGLPETELSKAADPETIALLANNLWQQAASRPDYPGLPYSASDPVTVADAAAARDANPANWPRNADLISPVSSAANQPVPIGETSTSPTSPTEPAPVTGTQNVNVVNTPNVRVDGPVDINWGDAPTVHEPSINGTPTAQQILSPILTLMPGLRALVIPKPAMVCPTASFSVFDHAFVVDSHCEVVEAARPTLFSVMAFVWVALGAMIVLRA